MAVKRGPGRPRKFSREEAREIRRAVKNNETTLRAAAEARATSLQTMSNVVHAKGAYSNTL